VNFPDPFGILSLAHQNNVEIQVCSGSLMAGSPRYATIPSGVEGFYYFGASPAIVRIVALKDTEFVATGAYLGAGNRTCDIVFPVSSASFSSLNASRICFFLTATNVSAHLTGSLGSSLLQVANSSGYEEFGTIPDVDLTNFQLLSLTNGLGLGSDFSISFSGGRPEMDFDAVTIQSHAGVIGRGTFVSYDSLADDPGEDPDESPSGSLVAILLPIFLTLVLFAISIMLFICLPECNAKVKLVLYEKQNFTTRERISTEDDAQPSSISSDTVGQPPSPYDNIDAAHL
jgi:hypothetical protein